MRDFNVPRCVVDALPETRNARAFAERHRGKVFLNYYNEHQKGSYAWNERDLIVSCNRTESLDACHREIMKGEIVLPREDEMTRTFADTCTTWPRGWRRTRRRLKAIRLRQAGAGSLPACLQLRGMARGAQIQRLFPDFDISRHTH